MSTRTILFVAEAVTLAHVARPFVLANSLDPERYRVEFACHSRFDQLFPTEPIKRRPLWSISTDQFLFTLRSASPLYDSETLERYVDDDLRLIREVQPHLIVGDFRLSLSVSARLASVPYAAITNAYWSPYASQRYPVPDLPLTRVLGGALAQRIFDVIRPAAFALHTRPLARVRRKHGLRDLGLNLRVTYSDADWVLYADMPGLIDMIPFPDNHHFLGPIHWSPSYAVPEWWSHACSQRPVVYVNLGSSGHPGLLPRILSGLQQANVHTIAAKANAGPLSAARPGVWVANFLPGNAAASAADLVICNGGSLATQQAIEHGKPILGVPSNLDQHLNMQAISVSGAGKTIRSDQLTSKMVASAVTDILATQCYSTAAELLRDRADQYNGARIFRDWLGRLVL